MPQTTAKQTTTQQSSNYWNWPIKELLIELQSSEQGLTEKLASKKLLTYGPNEFVSLQNRKWLQVLLSQFKNSLILILIVISIFSFFVGEEINGTIILIMILFNSFVGFWQEIRAEKSLEKLKKYISFEAKVIRAGKNIKLDTKQIVPGDLVILNVGDIVPADMVILESHNLSINESILTGESMPVEKKQTNNNKGDTPQAIEGGVFMGTSVNSGYAKCIVVGTGRQTFLGKSVNLSDKNTSQITNFEKNLNGFSNSLLKVVIVLTILVSVLNVLIGRTIVDSLLFGITLALGLTPEVLPIIITISISRAAAKMAKMKVVVRRLTALEDLGNIDVLCTDKTGTLTEGKLMLTDYVDTRGGRAEQVLIDSLLCNSSNPTLEGKLMGNPIDRAIWGNILSRRYHPQVNQFQILDYEDFSFSTQRMAVLVKSDRKNLIVLKGSFQAVEKVCTNNLTERMSQSLQELSDVYESKGFRVVCLATRKTTSNSLAKGEIQTNKDFEFQGFILFNDPLKPKLQYIFSQLKSLDIQLKIITGDSATITRSVCEQAGMEVAGNEIIQGPDLENLSTKDFALKIEQHNIFARVTPEQKNDIIGIFKEQGHVVAYLGDGINDVGALTKADVGISVNNATDVAKDSADIILLEKNLVPLIRGIQEGRKTFNNTWKFIINTMSSSFGNIFTIGVSSLFLKFFPLLPTQVLLIDSTSDIQHLTVSTDNVDKELLLRPQHWDLSFIWKFMIVFGLISSIFDLIVILPMSHLQLPANQFQTVLFTSSVLTETLAFFSIRTQRPFWKSKPSKMFVFTSILAIAVAVIIPLIPVTRIYLNFTILDLSSWQFIIITTMGYFTALEIGKRFFYRFIHIRTELVD